MGLPMQAGFPLAIAQQTQFWQAPYPPPEAVERYEKVLAGSFDRILAMAEAQQQAQIKAAEASQTEFRKATSRGQWLGFVSAGLAMGGAMVCAAIGSPVVAGIFISVPVLAVALALINSTKKTPTLPVQAVPSPPHKPG